MKRTKIICTIGPSSQNPETIRELIKEGMDVARLNFSHGSYEEQTNKFRMVRDAAKELGRSVAILQDTKGPEIRLRDFANGKEELEAGQTFTLTTEEMKGTKDKVSISYKNLPNDVKEGMAILMVTHDVTFAAKCADRCAMLFRGQVVSEGKPKAFFAENLFYTTPVSRMTRGLLDGCLTVEDAAAALDERAGKEKVQGA